MIQVTRVTWLERRKWSEVESEMRREREKMGRWKKGWVERREDIREERGKKEKSIYGEKISASSSSREEGWQLFMDCVLAYFVASRKGREGVISAECDY